MASPLGDSFPFRNPLAESGDHSNHKGCERRGPVTPPRPLAMPRCCKYSESSCDSRWIPCQKLRMDHGEHSPGYFRCSPRYFGNRTQGTFRCSTAADRVGLLDCEEKPVRTFFDAFWFGSFCSKLQIFRVDRKMPSISSQDSPGA